MVIATSQLAEALQTLVDARLDTIDRMLVGQVPRQERLDIVREVESQIFELLQDREEHKLTRDDVLAVLARLDPPEAYLSDDVDGETVFANPKLMRQAPARHERGSDPRMAKVSGILGLSTMALSALSPLLYIFTIGPIFIASILGIVLAAYSRPKGLWGVIGMVTSVMSLLFSIALALILAELG